MSAVVERCPNCGVEHEASHAGPCEVCGSELRFWCQRHSREAGWLSGPECPRCVREAKAREAEARRAPPPPPPPRAPVEHHRPPARPTHRPPLRRDPRPAPRVDARDVLPHVATGANLAIRLVHAVVVLVRTVFLWAFLGAAGGAAYGFAVGAVAEEVIWIALFALVSGGMVGLLLGLILAVLSFLTPRSRS